MNASGTPVSALVCAAGLLISACGSADNSGSPSSAPPQTVASTVSPPSAPALSDGEVAAQARKVILAQFGLGPDQTFQAIPQQGYGDWGAEIDHMKYVRDSRELDVFMTISTSDRDTALDAAHTIGLMVRGDPVLQSTINAILVGDRTGDALAHQYLCPPTVNDTDCEPAVWLK